MEDKKIKIIMINESFSSPIFYRRWELFAEKYKNVDLTLLTPDVIDRKIGKATFGHEVHREGKEVEKSNFHIRLFTRKKNPLGWTSPDFKHYLLTIKPDVVYNIGSHNQFSLYQLIHLTKKYLPSSKVISFSMRGPVFDADHFKDKCKPLSKYLIRRFGAYYYMKLALRYFNKNCDAVFCHYPDAVECFKREGYKGPIYMQTQVGVNPELFHKDEMARYEIRKKYGISDDTWLFGSATRFTIDKGIDDIVNALPKEGNWKYFMMGSGPKRDIDRLSNLIKRRGLEDKIIMTGFIPLIEMPKYWNAIDCMIHVPHTAYSWVETFSIALVQNMITQNPVIGSDSGSVPYQIGPDGIIVPEQNIKALTEKIQWVMNHRVEAREIGKKMFKRANNCFGIFHLNDMFYDTIIQDIIPGKYDIHKSDMVDYISSNETERV